MTNFRRNEIGRTSWIYPCDIACILRNNNDKMTAKSHWFLTRPNSSPNLVHCQKPRAIRAALDGGVPGITRLSPWISAACSWVPQVILTSHVPSRWKSQTTTPISGQLQASCSVSRGPKPTTYNITTIVELNKLPNTPNIIQLRFAMSASFPHSPWPSPSCARAEADRHQIRLRSSQEKMIYARQGLRSNRLLEDGHLPHPPMCRKVVVFTKKSRETQWANMINMWVFGLT